MNAVDFHYRGVMVLASLTGGITSASQGEFRAGLSLGGIFAVPPMAQSPLEIREKSHLPAVPARSQHCTHDTSKAGLMA